MDYLFYPVLAINIIIIIILFINLFTAPKILNKPVKLNSTPLVSVLIPARNEESNISNCINSIINQNYPKIEVIVLDDNSEDNTYNIVKNISENNKKVKIIKGKPLLKGWKGKNWACYQLSEHANGEYLLFLDADVFLAPYAISYSLHLMYKYNLNALSSFPTQLTYSFGEKIIVPLMKWLLLSFLPLRLVYSSPNKSFIAANGQFLMFSKNTYNLIGTHYAVKDKVVEDMEFALLLKNYNLKLLTTIGADAIFCKMYSNFSTAFFGFSKNYFPGFKVNAFSFIFIQIIFILLFFLPFILLFFNIKFLYIAILILLGRVLLANLTKENYFLSILLHPMQMITLFAIGINSVILTKTKRIKWKGRKI